MSGYSLATACGAEPHLGRAAPDGPSQATPQMSGNRSPAEETGVVAAAGDSVVEASTAAAAPAAAAAAAAITATAGEPPDSHHARQPPPTSPLGDPLPTTLAELRARMDAPFSTEEVCELVRRTPQRKAVTGPLAPWLLKHASSQLAPLVTAELNAWQRVGRLAPSDALSATAPCTPTYAPSSLNSSLPDRNQHWHCSSPARPNSKRALRAHAGDEHTSAWACPSRPALGWAPCPPHGSRQRSAAAAAAAAAVSHGGPANPMRATACGVRLDGAVGPTATASASAQH